ncbi:MAG: MurNAc alpha-1-phosphate uridylyltransferase, partial [Candidatus Azotimanducaceae bacterium]
DAWNPDQMDALLVCVPVNKTVGYSGNGDFAIDANGSLLRGNGTVYGGVQIIKTDRLAAVGETAFSLNVIWDQMLKDERLFGIKYTGNWCDVGHPDGIKMAEDMLNV